MRLSLFMFLPLLFLSACSTVLDRSQQVISVETPGAQEALCTLENRDMKYKVRAPKTLTITKSAKPLHVRCIAPGNREAQTVITPKTTDSIFLNTANGIVPGMIVDRHTAAMYEYPAVISVDFSQIAASPMPLPAYQQLLNDNPNLIELEEFRAGRSALQRDRYDRIPTLQKTDRHSFVSEKTEPPSAPLSMERAMNPYHVSVTRDSQGYEVPAVTAAPQSLTPLTK
ncbi:MAG: hypothetical protein KDJ15_05320 [Alphaproteobacteria bacterium]|nr:hypothetical protein [Alphaproteobacteria bacterium]